jgi:hypothetical protein
MAWRQIRPNVTAAQAQRNPAVNAGLTPRHIADLSQILGTLVVFLVGCQLFATFLLNVGSSGPSAGPCRKK